MSKKPLACQGSLTRVILRHSQTVGIDDSIEYSSWGYSAPTFLNLFRFVRRTCLAFLTDWTTPTTYTDSSAHSSQPTPVTHSTVWETLGPPLLEPCDDVIPVCDGGGGGGKTNQTLL